MKWKDSLLILILMWKDTSLIQISWSFTYSHIPTKIYCILFLHFSRSDWDKMASQNSFNLCLPEDSRWWALTYLCHLCFFYFLEISLELYGQISNQAVSLILWGFFFFRIQDKTLCQIYNWHIFSQFYIYWLCFMIE